MLAKILTVSRFILVKINNVVCKESSKVSLAGHTFIG